MVKVYICPGYSNMSLRTGRVSQTIPYQTQQLWLSNSEAFNNVLSLQLSSHAMPSPMVSVCLMSQLSKYVTWQRKILNHGMPSAVINVFLVSMLSICLWVGLFSSLTMPSQMVKVCIMSVVPNMSWGEEDVKPYHVKFNGKGLDNVWALQICLGVRRASWAMPFQVHLSRYVQYPGSQAQFLRGDIKAFAEFS